jgi:hypothetical protein
MCFDKRLTIINSQLPANLRASVGVAIVINKNLIDVEDLETTVTSGNKSTPQEGQKD